MSPCVYIKSYYYSQGLVAPRKSLGEHPINTKSMKYYRLLDALGQVKNRWFLKSINLVDTNKISVWKFVSPEEVIIAKDEELKLSIREYGVPLDFTFADFEVLIINERVAALLKNESCQLLPIKIQGIQTNHNYFVLILLTVVDCLDEQRSEFEKWEIGNTIRPDKAGQYKSISSLFIDSNKIPAKDSIFRLGKAENVIIINEDLKSEFERNVITGIQYQNVS